MQIGVQFFTLRDHCRTLDEFALSLRRVADMGYKTVQISATCAFEPQWLKEQLAANGLECVLTHTRALRILSETEQVCQEHSIFGCNYIGLGSYPFDPEKDGQDYDRFIRDFLPAARIMTEHGKYFMYHNHDREFSSENSFFFALISSDIYSAFMIKRHKGTIYFFAQSLYSSI